MQYLQHFSACTSTSTTTEITSKRAALSLTCVVSALTKGYFTATKSHVMQYDFSDTFRRPTKSFIAQFFAPFPGRVVEKTKVRGAWQDR